MWDLALQCIFVLNHDKFFPTVLSCIFLLLFACRYKDSISKGTQGFREKLLARNSSVKELSKGVQREMTSSIAGVARMIERLDLKSKRNMQSGEVCHDGETSNFFSKGKGVLDNIIASSRENRVVTDGDLNLHKKSQATCSITSHKDVSCAEVRIFTSKIYN